MTAPIPQLDDQIPPGARIIECGWKWMFRRQAIIRRIHSYTGQIRQPRRDRKVLVGPDIITRGWVYAPEAEDLLDEACDRVSSAVETALRNGERDVEALERDVRRAAGKFVSERTRRRPMIVPVVMET